MKKTVVRSYGLAVKAVFGSLALSCAAVPAMADVTVAPQRAVAFNDLDVSQTPGATLLYKRIASAAEAVCAHLDRPDLSSKMLFTACVNKALTDAVTTVNQPVLLAVYQARQGSRRPASLVSFESPSASTPSSP